jgi:hypothetical protein
LNAIYVQAPRQIVSKLIGTSVAMFMIGISVSPTIAGVLPDFRMSFIMAMILFAITLLYILICVPNGSIKRSPSNDSRSAAINTLAKHEYRKTTISNFMKTTMAPLSLLSMKPPAWIPAIALFLYNLIQSYAFTAIMVHTSIEFGFSSKKNGFLISIVHGVASIYLLLTLFLGPFLANFVCNSTRKKEKPLKSRARTDASLAVSAMFTQSLALFMLGFATLEWQVYGSVALCAFGLSAPSFVKAYFVTIFDKSDGPQAVAALAIMETIGGLVAPLVFGGIQSFFPGKEVFFLAASCILLATAIFGVGFTILNPSKLDGIENDE